jgi:hypothetical protein
MRSMILATVLALGFAGTASAQYYGYNYKTYNPATGSVISGRMTYTPYGAQNNYTYVNPVVGYAGQSARYADVFGNQLGQTVRVNPYTGLGYTSGYYNPGIYANPYMNPYAGYRYRYFWR